MLIKNMFQKLTHVYLYHACSPKMVSQPFFNRFRSNFHQLPNLCAKHERSPIIFFAIGSGSAIAIWLKDRSAIGDRKIKDRDRKNAIFLAIVVLYIKHIENTFFSKLLEI
jgi:hypothetical protein